MGILNNTRKKQLENHLNIQMENNKMLREMFREEQKMNKDLQVKNLELIKENVKLKNEIEALKRNVRVAYKQPYNETKKKTTRKPRVKKDEK